MSEVALALKDVHAWYGMSQALHGIDIEVRKGEFVTILGRNGAGKTTTLKSVVGQVGRRSGSFKVHGTDISGVPTHLLRRHGLGYVPEDRGIYSTLTVMENLLLPRGTGRPGMTLDAVFELFPNLKERQSSWGSNLSGGEQQMLAIARVLLSGADILLFDEPTEGLAPAIIEQIAAVLRILKGQGKTVLLVEQNLAFAMALSDRAYLMETGRIVGQFDSGDFADQRGRLAEFMGV